MGYSFIKRPLVLELLVVVAVALVIWLWGTVAGQGP